MKTLQRRRISMFPVWAIALPLASWNALAADYPGLQDGNIQEQHAPPVVSRDIRVDRDGEGFHVNAVMRADVPVKLAWDVLTDFVHMRQILPDLSVSEVTPGADAQHFTVRQVGVARFGPFSRNYESTREISLEPFQRIVAKNIAGNVKAMNSVMTLVPDNGGTRMVYQANVLPDSALPPLVGPAAVRGQTAAQFSALINEMIKRHQAEVAATLSRASIAH